MKRAWAGASVEEIADRAKGCCCNHRSRWYLPALGPFPAIPVLPKTAVEQLLQDTKNPAGSLPAGPLLVGDAGRLFRVVRGFGVEVITRIGVGAVGFTFDCCERIVADRSFGALRQFGGMLFGG